MKPTYNSNSHAAYQRRVKRALHVHGLRSRLPRKYLSIDRQFCDMDLAEVDRIMQDPIPHSG